MERETIEYLNPQEQLKVAAMVNRLCEISPEDFDATMHLEDAREIVKALDPKIGQASPRLSMAITLPSSESSQITGTTEHGDVSMPAGENEPKEMRIGKLHEYRIGMYVATRRDNRDVSSLTFEHFWDRGEINEALDNDGPETSITYTKEDLDVFRISRHIPKLRHWGPLKITSYNRIDMWNK